ncbi:MAG: hypothetical protein AAGA01_12205 [Cyanobacteria bacterium P01_E01_bin.43]
MLVINSLAGSVILALLFLHAAIKGLQGNDRDRIHTIIGLGDRYQVLVVAIKLARSS